MDIPGEDGKHSVPNGSWRSVMTNSVNPGRKGSHGFLHKLFSRQPSMPKLVTVVLEDQASYSSFDKLGDSSNRDLEATPCPYIHPLGIRLEPRVENAPLVPQRPLANSALSMSRKKEESSRSTHICLSLEKADEDQQDSLSVLDGMTLRSLRLREDIASAATADSGYQKDWGYYIKCYSEVRLGALPCT
jgi:hypothetical protein